VSPSADVPRPGNRLIRAGILAAAVVALAVIVAFQAAGPATTVATIAQWQPGMTVLRCAILFLLIGGWRVWIGSLCRRYGLTPVQSQALLHSRWRFAGFLVFLELAFLQGGLVQLFAFFGTGVLP